MKEAQSFIKIIYILFVKKFSFKAIGPFWVLKYGQELHQSCSNGFSKRALLLGKLAIVGSKMMQFSYTSKCLCACKCNSALLLKEPECGMFLLAQLSNRNVMENK